MESLHKQEVFKIPDVVPLLIGHRDTDVFAGGSAGIPDRSDRRRGNAVSFLHRNIRKITVIAAISIVMRDTDIMAVYFIISDKFHDPFHQRINIAVLIDLIDIICFMMIRVFFKTADELRVFYRTP